MLLSGRVGICRTLGTRIRIKPSFDSWYHHDCLKQKIQANASFRNNVDRARAKKQLDRKELRLAQTLATLEALEEEKASINMVDTDAKIMRHKDRRILPSYNHQSSETLRAMGEDREETFHIGNRCGSAYGVPKGGKPIGNGKGLWSQPTVTSKRTWDGVSTIYGVCRKRAWCSCY